MLRFDLAQLQPLIGALFWPFVRIGACLMVAPVFGAQFVPRRIRILLAAAFTLLVAPLLPPSGTPELMSVDGFMTTFQQVLIGLVLGSLLQMVFDAVALGGQLLANGMGLGFAFNLDPLRGVTTPALGQLYLVLGTLTFLSLNGHLALIQLLNDSFRALPVGTDGLAMTDLRLAADWGSAMFAGSLRIALPGMTALLVVNLAFGVVSRAAPSLNLFAVGLPVTLVVGIAVVLFALPAMQSGFVTLMNQGFQFLRMLLGMG